MKTRAIITAIIAAASISSLQSKAAKPSASAAQELLTDGKVWNCVQRMYNDQTGEYDRPFTITVVGDTIVGDVKCKRLEQFWNDDTATLSHFAALERDARVYLVIDEEQREFLNFDLSVGDIDGCAGRVISVDKVVVNGISRKRITIDRSGHLQYLVEGIGLSDDYLRYYEQNSFYNVVQSVIEEGMCVFAARDFKSGTAGIHPTDAATGSHTCLSFDLLGRPISSETNKAVVIKNGKKYLLKPSK